MLPNMQPLHDSDDENNYSYNNDGSSNSKSYNVHNKKDEIIHRQRGRPPKVRRDSPSLVQSPHSSPRSHSSPTKNLTPAQRRKREKQSTDQQLQRIQAESFVMKLFDRSLDLSRYTECTELYPICRAWMANQPRNPSIHYDNRRSPSPVARQDNATQIYAKLKRGEIVEVTSMPLPEKIEAIKLPPIEAPKKDPEEETLNYKDATREELLALHLDKWKSTKSTWLKQIKLNQQRYKLNHMIIQELFKP